MLFPSLKDAAICRRLAPVAGPGLCMTQQREAEKAPQSEIAVRVQVKLHTPDMAIARIGDVALPKASLDLAGVSDQRQVALRDAAVIERHRIVRVVQENADNASAEPVPTE